MSQLLTEYSPWYLPLCILLGLLYAFLLYTLKAPWGLWTNRLLFAFRFLLTALLAALLIGPYLRLIRNQSEKPIVALALDHSASIPLVTPEPQVQALRQRLSRLTTDLQTKGFEVLVYGMDGFVPALDSLRFDAQKTDLGSLLRRVQTDTENRNLSSVLLVSDGIYNQGTSPLYTAYPFAVHTVGIGDTTPRADLSIKAVYANNVAYLGNKFPIVVELGHTRFAGKTSSLVLSRQGKVLETRPVSFGETPVQTVEFLIPADEIGMQRYQLELKPLNGEFTRQNNLRNAYIDILDSREKILLLAAAPHPDLKALRNALETNENYQIEVFIPALDNANRLQPVNRNDKFDLVILHQLPHATRVLDDWIQKLEQAGTPMLYIVGAATQPQAFNLTNGIMTIPPSFRQTDKVTPVVNARFGRFGLETATQGILASFPPLTVPYGEYRLNGGTETLLQQRVGSIATDKPLVVTGEKNTVKRAVIIGEGLWMWRLQNFAQHQNYTAFDEWILKMAKYLSSKEDKRKFRAYPSSAEYLVGENVPFEVEAYNSIYERVYGLKVELTLRDDKGSQKAYQFVQGGPGSRYAVSGLSEGIYRYEATALLDGRQEKSSGTFTIKKLEVEALNTTADFQLLRTLSQQSGGTFVTHTELDRLAAQLAAVEPVDVLHSEEELSEVLSLWWLLAGLMLLATLEWGIRRYRGGY